MDIKTVFLCLGLLWLGKRIAHARHVDLRTTELDIVDPYAGLTSAWDRINGTVSPNAHQTIHSLGKPTSLYNPCVCK
jgi:hypothetical protein